MSDPMITLGELVQQPSTVWKVVFCLVLWAAISASLAGSKTWRATRALRSARKRLARVPDAAAFTADFEEISLDLGNARLIGHRWRGYRDTLLIDASGRQPIRASVPAEHWFDASLLQDTGINLRYHAALPGMLVGAGLFFTFLGLTFALQKASAVVADNVTQTDRTHALQQLLDLASFKFITSLFGLGLSILYTWFWKAYCLRRIDRAIAGFVQDLNQRIPLCTELAAQEEANALAERQLTQLETFSTDLAVALGEKLDSAFDQRLGEHIAPLREAMERLAARTADDNAETIQRMMDAFLQRLQGGTGDKMQEAGERLAELGASLKGLESGLREAASRMADAAEAMTRRMGEGAEAALSRITDQMTALAETLRGVAEQARSVGTEAGRDMAERIAHATNGFETAARTIASTLTQSAEALQRRMGQEAEAGSARMTAQFEAMLNELRALAEASRNTGDQALEQLAERIGAAASAFEATAGRVAQALAGAAHETGGALGRGAEEAVARIATATEGMRNELQAMLAEFRLTLGSAGNALREGGAAGAAALSGSLDAAGQGLAGAITGAAAGLREAGEAAATSLQRGGESAGSKLDSAGDEINQRAASLARQVGELAAAAQILAARIGELQQAAGQAAPPLVSSAKDLRAASEAARNTVQPLREVAQTVTTAVEQIGGAAQRLQAAESRAEATAQALTIAAQRFEGVDQQLGQVFERLNHGLHGFTSQIEKFVIGTDQNLANAARQLEGAIRQLEGALEDYRPPARSR